MIILQRDGPSFWREVGGTAAPAKAFPVLAGGVRVATVPCVTCACPLVGDRSSSAGHSNFEFERWRVRTAVPQRPLDDSFAGLVEVAYETTKAEYIYSRSIILFPISFDCKWSSQPCLS